MEKKDMRRLPLPSLVPQVAPQPAPSIGPGRGRSHQMAKVAGCTNAASPDLIMGGQAALGTEGSTVCDTRFGVSRWHVASRTGDMQAQTQAFDTGWPWPHNYHTALLHPGKKRGKTRGHLQPPAGLRWNIPLAASTESPIPQWEAMAKLQP